MPLVGRSPSSPQASHRWAARLRGLAQAWERVRPGVLRWVLRLGIAAGVATGAGALAIAVVVSHFEAGLPATDDLRAYHAPQVTRVLARDGSILAEVFTERRTDVPIGALPAHVKLAVLAAEDAGFYEHEGLNYAGIVRALLVNLRARGTRQGGSTITQQVVKNLLLNTHERTFSRKIREALLARRLEQTLSKDAILELYLNNIYLGRGRYGIEEAARDDFGVPAANLTVAQAATIAGRIANPRDFHPRANVTAALSRRAYVLQQMRDKGFLTEAQWAAAKAESLVLAPLSDSSNGVAPEAVEIAKAALARLEPEQARLGGFTVTMTIDPRLQTAARKSMREALAAYDKRRALVGPLHVPPASAAARHGRSAGTDAPFEGTPNFDQHRTLVGTVAGADDAAGTFDVRVGTAVGVVKVADCQRYNPGALRATEFAPVGAIARVSLLAPLPDPPGKVPLRLELGPEGAAIAIDTRTRDVLALVGSYEGLAGTLDRATQAHRQPGSTFKPIVYSYALHTRRYTAATLVDPSPDVFEGGYRPTNFEGWQGRDPLRLREALANSVNIPAVRVLADVGPANVVSWAQALGITSRLEPDLSLALGSYEVRPMELAGAYATFAAGGVYEEPRLIMRITGPDGRDLPVPSLTPPRRVLDDAEAFVVTDLLTSVIDHGTGARAQALGRPLAGKTGTSNGPKDTWFAGYSTDLTAVTWIGYDDGRVLGSAEQGAVTALPAWMGIMKAAHEDKPRLDFPRPPGVATVSIDARSGELAYPDDPDAMDEVFLAGTEPTQ
ncbi:MAG: PBP1A family penicillin-binding protein, partial [Polyangiaceae bacterium]|nr:PBP1A family penicillin-binding protein [Polyangiaceae bacterium]